MSVKNRLAKLALGAFAVLQFSNPISAKELDMGIYSQNKTPRYEISKNIANFKGKDYSIILTEDSDFVAENKRVKIKAKNGSVSLEKILNQNQDNSLHLEIDGMIRIENGRYNIICDKKECESEPNFFQNTLEKNLETDMRIVNNDKIYDFNVAKNIVKQKSDEQLNFDKNEIKNILELKHILEELPKNDDVDFRKVNNFLNEQIRFLKKEYVLVPPVFGEVVTNKKIKKNQDGNYNGCAVVLSYSTPYNVVARNQAENLAKDNKYTLLLIDELDNYNDFFNLLKYPNLKGVEKEMKLGIIDINSHMWSGEDSCGIRIGDDSKSIHNDIIESDSSLNFKELYYKYLSKGRVRVKSYETLSDKDIKLIQNNFSDDAKIRFNGCQNSQLPKIGTTTYDYLRIPLSISVVGTQFQKYYPKLDIWSPYELNENGKPKYFINNNNKRQKLENVIYEGDTVRLWPNQGLLNQKNIQKLYQDINGFLRITDKRKIEGKNFYRIEYDTDKKSFRAWVRKPHH